MAITETTPAKTTRAAKAKPAKGKAKPASAREQVPDLTPATWKAIANSTDSAEDLAKKHKLPDHRVVTRCRTWARRFGLLKTDA